MLTLTEEQQATLADLVAADKFANEAEALKVAIEMLWNYCQPEYTETPEEIAELKRRCEALDRGEGVHFESIEAFDAKMRGLIAERAASRVEA